MQTTKQNNNPARMKQIAGAYGNQVTKKIIFKASALVSQKMA